MSTIVRLPAAELGAFVLTQASSVMAVAGGHASREELGDRLRR